MKQETIDKGNNQLEMVSSEEEAVVLVKNLERALNKDFSSFSYISSVHLNINKNLAIVKNKNSGTIPLVNAKIIDFGKKSISFEETCINYPKLRINCFRYAYIKVYSEFFGELEFHNEEAFLVQKALDSLYNIDVFSRKIRLAQVRENGFISRNDFCPCGSKNKYSFCCGMKAAI